MRRSQNHLAFVPAAITGTLMITGGVDAQTCQWAPLGSGMGHNVIALNPFGGDIYAGGHFTTAGGAAAGRIARWDGQTWSALGSGMGGTPVNIFVSGMLVYDGALHAGGSFSTAGGTSANSIARWNGQSWSALGSGITSAVVGRGAHVGALAVFQGQLYAGGSFTQAGGTPSNNIARWNGQIWSPLGSGTDGTVRAMAVYGNVLYVGGSFSSAGGVSATNRIARWNGQTWLDVDGNPNGVVHALTVFDGALYVGGAFNSILNWPTGANNIARLQNNAWSQVDAGLNGPVYALVAANSHLYVAGAFTSSGIVAANNIAAWDPHFSEWVALGTGLNDEGFAVAELDGTVYVGGAFSSAGGQAAGHIAAWECQPGACCLPDATCAALGAVACASAGGTHLGLGSDCASAQCPGGACCLPDGSCLFVTAALCASEFSGTFQGTETDCGTQRCAMLPVLWNNGPMVSHPGMGCNGGDLSLVQAPNTSGGWNWTGFADARLADNFTIPDGEVWQIDEITLWALHTNATMPTFTEVWMQIWDGRPGQFGSEIIAGNLSVNRLANASLTNIYRAWESDPAYCGFRLQRLECIFPISLASGTYWIDVQTAGTQRWLSPVTFAGRTGKPHANMRQFFLGAGWNDVLDPGSGAAQDFPFHIRGLVVVPCYANCDDSTMPPVLNVDDFTCFINRFAEAQGLPHEQQIEHYANCDGSTTPPVLNVDDFTCFINAFAVGCD